ncbi:MAG TPA: insulinase family protein, partial [Flavobacteriaceae bacterium]|nr:insulinase family protein [Flavobacteriaceae bacterium]
MKKYIIPFLLLFVAVSMHAQIDRSKQPIPGAAPAIHLQTPQTFELENGLKVLVVKNTKLPRVRIQLLIDNPPIALNKKVGVENILAYVLGNGTTTISKQDFNEEIDFMGANISFGNNSGYASTLSKYFDRVFELFADAIINPLITEEEFQTQKNRYLEALKNNKKDVATTSRQVSLALLFGQKHPFGEFATEENVADITYSDIKQY